MDALLAQGKTVLLETGGHVPLDRVDPRVIKIVDVKAPGSGMESANLPENLERLGPRDELKFVLAGPAGFRLGARSRPAKGPGPAPRRDLLAGLGDARGARPRRLDPRQRPQHPPGAPAPQAPLGRRARTMSASPPAVVLLSGGLDSATCLLVARVGRLRGPRALVRLRAAPSRRARASARARRALRRRRAPRLPAGSPGPRRLRADRSFGRDPQGRARARADPLHLRPRAQHALPRARARLGRAPRRPGHLSRRERARLLRLPGLPARVPRGLRDDGESRRRRPASRGSRRSGSARRCCA